jgi:Dyp-type peroxidase family
VEATTTTPALALDQIQGNIAGFNKDHQRFVFLHFSDKATAQAFLAEIADDIATCDEVLEFNALFKKVYSRRHQFDEPQPGAPPIDVDRNTVEGCWINLGLTFSGLQLLEAPGLDGLPEEFKQKMRERAERLGDKDLSDPQHWVTPFTEGNEIHAVVIIAADEDEDLQAEYSHLQQHCSAHQVQELDTPQDGNTRPGAAAGHEHFGFKDGISQPGIIGLASDPKPGQDMLPAGEFILGYPGGDEPPAPPPAPPGAYDPQPPQPPPQPPDWTKNGSFLVFRRLRQNVQAFNDFLAQAASANSMTEDLLGAKFVGRYKSGAALEHTADEGPDVDPNAGDPSTNDPTLLSAEKINNFDYDQDPDGQFVPRAAHIRKTNPRSGNPRGKEDSNRHRILRRGIPYGPEFQLGEPPYPGTEPPPDTQDRGLLFVCYQASIASGFEFIQTQWANQNDFPQQGDGRDPIISQDVADPEFSLPRTGTEPLHLTLQRWVTTTGGEYFFSPSIGAIKTLAGSS